MRRLLTLFFVFAVFCSDGRAQNEAVKIEQTTDREKDGLVQFFKRSALSLSIDEAGAHFQMRKDAAKFCLGDPGTSHEMNFKFEFTLSKPGEVFYSPDHHCMRVFTVKRITDDRLLLGYRTTFDHRSFGKNTITEDAGEIELHSFHKP